MANQRRSSEAVSSTDNDLSLMRRIAEASANAVCAEAGEFDGAVASVRRAISQADASKRLRLAVEVAASRDAVALEALRIAVSEFTFALRSEGHTPEAVLIKLKELIAREALPVGWIRTSDRGGYLLRESISSWSINAYFSGDGSSS